MVESAYFAFALLIGIGMSLLLEAPVLILWEGFYPRRASYFQVSAQAA